MKQSKPSEPPPSKRNRGNQPYETTPKDRQLVKVLSGFAIPHAKICDVLGITLPTLYKYFERELKTGAAEVEAQLVGNLLRIAQGSDAPALRAIMFALNCRFNWSAYAPIRTQEIGKKERANIEAEYAHEDDDDWSGLVN